MGCCATRETFSNQAEAIDQLAKGSSHHKTPISPPPNHDLYTPQSHSKPTANTTDDKLLSQSGLPINHIPSSHQAIEDHKPVLQHTYSQQLDHNLDFSPAELLKLTSSHINSSNQVEKSSNKGCLSISSGKEEIVFSQHKSPKSEIPYRANLEERITPRHNAGSVILPGFEETPGDLLKYGDVIIFTHKNTWNSLHSHTYTYMSGSMGQQVVCLSERAENDKWKICRGFKSNGEKDTETEVRYGSILRLKHRATKSYLTSQLDVPSPYSNQQEVSCEKESSEKQNWILEPSDEFVGEEWSSNHDMKLKHIVTGKYLQSGELQFNLGHGNLQEVFASDKLEGDEIWLIELKSS